MPFHPPHHITPTTPPSLSLLQPPHHFSYFKKNPPKLTSPHQPPPPPPNKSPLAPLNPNDSSYPSYHTQPAMKKHKHLARLACFYKKNRRASGRGGEGGYLGTVYLSLPVVKNIYIWRGEKDGVGGCSRYQINSVQVL